MANVRTHEEPKPSSKEKAPAGRRSHCTADELEKIDAYWRAANYLSVGQIYLYDNPLLQGAADAASTSSRGCSATGARRRA